jgi:drug/metabolite transporter (DMT)-like permease
MSSHSEASSRATLVLIAGAVCISFAAIFVKWLGEDTLGPTAIGFWRTIMGGIILFLMAAIGGKKLGMSAPIFGFAIVAGFIFFLDLFFWHRSILYSGAGMATILANTQVFATAVLGFLIFRERIGVRFVIAALSAMIGVVLLVGLATEEVAFSGRYAHGIIFGLLTGIVYASYIITVKRAGQRESFPDYLTFMAWASIFSAFFLGVATLLESSPAMPPDLGSWAILFLLALVAQALGWWAISNSLKKIPASRAGLILLLQPTLATVWGIIFFAEYLHYLQVIGAIITLTAIYIGSLRRAEVSN